MFRLTGRAPTIIGISLAALVISTLACSPSSTPIPATLVPLVGATLTPLPAPSATPVPTTSPAEPLGSEIEKAHPDRSPTPAVSGGADRPIQVTVINDLVVSACYIYISPSTEDTWGEDWLGETEILYAGNQRAFTLSAGQWDLMAANCSGDPVAREMQVQIQQDMSWWLSTSAVSP